MSYILLKVQDFHVNKVLMAINRNNTLIAWIRQVNSLFICYVINSYVHFKMFQYNLNANYQPNGGRYLQILLGKDLYKQTIVVSARDTFPVRFPNIFGDYPLESMKVGDKLWKNWNKFSLRLWQTQLNIVVWCASSACGVSSEHLNYAKHSMVKGVYQFHVYYYVRRVLKDCRFHCHTKLVLMLLTILTPMKNSLKFVRIMGSLIYDRIKYRDEKFYWTDQCGMVWPNDYIGPDSMTCWIIEKSQGFTNVGLLRMSESVRLMSI